ARVPAAVARARVLDRLGREVDAERLDAARAAVGEQARPVTDAAGDVEESPAARVPRGELVALDRDAQGLAARDVARRELVRAEALEAAGVDAHARGAYQHRPAAYNRRAIASRWACAAPDVEWAADARTTGARGGEAAWSRRWRRSSRGARS